MTLFPALPEGGRAKFLGVSGPLVLGSEWLAAVTFVCGVAHQLRAWRVDSSSFLCCVCTVCLYVTFANSVCI